MADEPLPTPVDHERCNPLYKLTTVKLSPSLINPSEKIHTISRMDTNAELPGDE